jgi:hypothetical protein
MSDVQIFMDHTQPVPEGMQNPPQAAELLEQIQCLLPRLLELAAAVELDGDYWFDLNDASELLAGVVRAFSDR